MKIVLFILFSCIVIQDVSAQGKEYVCTPCGNTCDNMVHDGPGTCATCHMKLIEKSSVRFSNLTIDEFCKRIAANPNAILLDVRSAGEFNGTSSEVATFGYFKNAININVNELESRLDELEKFKDREILVYCSHSRRSPRASYLLATHGFHQVKNMTGGVSTLSVQGSDCLKETFVAHKK